MDLRRSPGFLLLLTGAVASGLLLMRSQEEEPERNLIPRLGIGYYMANAQMVGTGDTGQVIYRMNARLAKQNPDEGGVLMEEVFFEYDPITEAPWELRADSGRIPPDGTMILLEGNVVAITREGDGATTTVRTEYLELDPEAFVADTRQKVSIEQEGGTVHGTGMRAWFKEDRLRLNSNVNGKFLP